MSKKITLGNNKSEYTRTSVESTLDMSFKELGTNQNIQPEETLTVSQFFLNYNELFNTFKKE